MIDNQLRNYIRKYHSVLFPGVIGQLVRRRKSIASSSAAKIFFGPSNLKSSHSKCKTSIFLSSAFSLSPSSCAVLIIIRRHFSSSIAQTKPFPSPNIFLLFLSSKYFPPFLHSKSFAGCGPFSSCHRYHFSGNDFTVKSNFPSETLTDKKFQGSQKAPSMVLFLLYQSS